MQFRLAITAAATILALQAPGATAQVFGNIYFFGDSLTDGGAFGGLGPLPPGARFTVDNAPNHADYLAAALGLQSVATNSANPATSQSGNNFAQGGARSEEVGNAGPGGLEIRDLPTQISDHLARTGGRADGNAVYFVWSGGNDIPAAAATPATAQATAAASATALAMQLGLLKARGANLIIAPNLPAFGNTPAAFYAVIDALPASDATKAALRSATGSILRNGPTLEAASQQARVNQALQMLASSLTGQTSGPTFEATLGQLTTGYATARSALNTLSQYYNLTADGALMASGANVIRADTQTLFAEVLANPAAFGLSNVTGSACPAGVSSLICTSADVNGNERYLFADDRHPSPATHRILGEYFASFLNAARFAEVVTAAPQGMVQGARQALDARYRTLDGAMRPAGAVDVYASVTGGEDHAGPASADPKGLVTAGIGYQLNATTMLGLAFTTGKTQSELSSVGQAESRSHQLTATYNLRQGPLWVDADAFFGQSDIDTRRTVHLGPLTRTETGSTSASQAGARVQGGYWVTLGPVRTGPMAGLRYDKVEVKALVENGSNSTTQHFGEQTVKSQVGTLGWTLTAPLGRFTPYAALSYNHAFNDDRRWVEAGLVNTRGEYRMQTAQRDRNWTEWQLGTSANLAKAMDGYLHVQGSSGREGGHALGVTLGLSGRF